MFFMNVHVISDDHQLASRQSCSTRGCLKVVLYPGTLVPQDGVGVDVVWMRAHPAPSLTDQGQQLIRDHPFPICLVDLLVPQVRVLTAIFL